MPVAYVGFGGNLGRVEDTLRRAIRRVGRLPSTRVTRLSSLYRSAPVGFKDQPDFVNGVLEIETDLQPAQLLQALLQIEDSLGRKREIPGGPRTVDLDLLLWGEEVIDAPGVRVPHPRMQERGFVLVPLAEIAPDTKHPVLGRTARELLEELGPASDVIPIAGPRSLEPQEEEPSCSAGS